jgi:hypothetical protein
LGITRRILWVLALVALVLAFGWYASRPVVPDGQPPLVTLDDNSLAALRADFNAAAHGARLIVLLAPT